MNLAHKKARLAEAQPQVGVLDADDLDLITRIVEKDRPSNPPLKTSYELLEEAFDLLEVSRDLLLIVDKYLDARNCSLPGDNDHLLNVTVMEINQLLNGLDRPLWAEKKEKTMTVMGPTSVRTYDKDNQVTQISYNCRGSKHSKCDLISCDCPCHDEEKEL